MLHIDWLPTGDTCNFTQAGDRERRGPWCRKPDMPLMPERRLAAGAVERHCAWIGERYRRRRSNVVGDNPGSVKCAVITAAGTVSYWKARRFVELPIGR